MSLIVIGLVALAALVGLAVGTKVQRRRSSELLRAAEREARGLLEAARQAAELRSRESSAQVRESALEIAALAEAEQRAYAEECALIAERLKKRDGRRVQREGSQRERRAELDQRAEAVRTLQAEARATRATAIERRQAERATLEERAGQTAGALCAQLVTSLVAESRSRAADLLRNLEATEALELDRQAKRVMGIAMQRYSGYCPRERSASIVALEGPEMGRLVADNQARLDAIRRMLGLDISLADDGSSLRIETGDGVLRELARRTILRFARSEQISDAQAVIDDARRQLEEEVVRHGRGAFKELSLSPAAAEITELVGKLSWRTSYTQNQYRHSIEAAQLAAMMAAELRLDPKIASRGTLLHDIGKALTHSVEGSHALLGADLARRHGEREEVANAVGAHHGEEPMGSPYAWLATAADAMSGGRPGARREMTEAYSDRIGDLEKIASAYRGVQAVHAVQAGRELRIHVDETMVGDERLLDLSEQIAKEISEELVFPGQIRVTVIREFRAIAEAG